MRDFRIIWSIIEKLELTGYSPEGFLIVTLVLFLFIYTYLQTQIYVKDFMFFITGAISLS